MGEWCEERRESVYSTDVHSLVKVSGESERSQKSAGGEKKKKKNGRLKGGLEGKIKKEKNENVATRENAECCKRKRTTRDDFYKRGTSRMYLVARPTGVDGKAGCVCGISSVPAAYE